MLQEEMWLLKEKYSGEKSDAFLVDCARLKAGEPLAYIIGHVPFLDATIYLDSHPLIPRTETEFWVGSVLRDMELKSHTDFKVLDLCAGSGCIGVAILKTFPSAHVDFVEIDEKHHPTIQKNVELNSIDPSRIQIISGNLFEKVHGMYDYILSNPPYIDKEIDRAEESVKKYEPHLALYGGTDGLALISQIIEESAQFLKPNGTLIIEHEPEQVSEMHHLGETNRFVSKSFPDQYGVLRFTFLTRKG